MQYLHDVWINPCSEENPYLIPHFHEWTKEEKILLMDTMPLIKVNNNLFDYIEAGYNKISDEILKDVHGKSFLRSNNEKKKVKYSFICTDGDRTIAVQLDDEGIVEKKSRLIPRLDQLIYEMTVSKKVEYSLEYAVDTSKYDRYAGYTRSEKESMTKINNFLDGLNESNVTMLKYLISEWSIELYNSIKDLDFDTVKTLFKNEIQKTKTEKLIDFNKLILKLKLAS